MRPVKSSFTLRPIIPPKSSSQIELQQFPLCRPIRGFSAILLNNTRAGHTAICWGGIVAMLLLQIDTTKYYAKRNLSNFKISQKLLIELYFTW